MIRFDTPVDWKIKKLTDCLEQIIDYRGKSTPKDSFGYQLITARNVRFGYIDFEPKEYMNPDDYREWMTRGFPKPGDVLFTTEAPLGNVALYPKGGTYALAQRLVTLRANQGVLDPNYLLYYLLSDYGQHQVNLKATGSTAIGIRQSELRKVPIILPPLPEQRKIAEVLSTWDEAIALTERLIAALQKRKKGLMQRLLTGQVRFPGFEGEWREVKLPEILSDGKSAIKVGPFGSQLKKNEMVKKGYKVYGQENVYQNDFRIGDRYVDEKKFEVLKSCRILPGDFLITMMGTIGKCAIVPNGIETGIQDSHLIRLRVNEKIYSRRFLVYLFQSYEINKQVKRMSVGGIMEGLSSTIIQQLKLPITSILEQEKIADVLELCDIEISLMTEQKEYMQSQKKGLMQRLLTGEVRVKV